MIASKLDSFETSSSQLSPQVLDPVWKEEATMGSRMTITVNAHGEICAIQKGGGVAITSDQVRVASCRTLESAVLIMLTSTAELYDLTDFGRVYRRYVYRV